ncbi:MAG: response regulator transcription factor [Candidatus Omnitrophica bacterium]|nr:response regulator transcription factor [Candidatus Omnitrophota bacterium]
MRKRLLIVDDHADFRAMLRNYLNQNESNLEIFEASTGEMGIAKASFVKPDIILMDISLPQANGLEATIQIKEENPQCHIIILTMFDVAVFKKAAEKLKTTEFIGKSEVYDRLLPAIKKCLEDTKIKNP